MAKDVIKEPFAVINGDDYYGKDSFRILGDWLRAHENSEGVYSIIVSACPTSEHVSADAEHVSTDAEHVSADAEHVSADTEHVSVDAEHVSVGAEHVSAGAEHVSASAE